MNLVTGLVSFIWVLADSAFQGEDLDGWLRDLHGRLRSLVELITQYLGSFNLPASVADLLETMGSSDGDLLRQIIFVGVGVALLLLGRRIARLFGIAGFLAGCALGASIYLAANPQDQTDILLLPFILLTGIAGAVITSHIYRISVIALSAVMGMTLSLVAGLGLNPITPLAVGIAFGLLAIFIHPVVEVLYTVAMGSALITMGMGWGAQELPLLLFVAGIGLALQLYALYPSKSRKPAD